MVSGKRRRLCAWGAVVAVQSLALCRAQAPGETADAREKRGFDSCVSSTTFAGLKDTKLIGDDTPSAVGDVFTCRAVMEKSPRACDKAEAWLHDQASARTCRELSRDLAVIVSAARNDPQAAALCRKSLPEQISEGVKKKACDDYVQTLRVHRDEAKFCERMVRLAAEAGIQPSFDLGGCRKIYAFMEGPKACQLETDVFSRRSCREKAFFYQALAGHDPRKCGSSSVCLSVLNSEASCSIPMRLAVESYCHAKVGNDSRDVLAQESKLRKENGLPPRKAGDPLLTPEFVAGVKAEMRLRAENGLRRYKFWDPLLPDSFWTRLIREKKFRRDNDLPPYKEGAPFLNELPPDQRIRYEKSPRRAKEERALRLRKPAADQTDQGNQD